MPSECGPVVSWSNLMGWERCLLELQATAPNQMNTSVTKIRPGRKPGKVNIKAWGSPPFCASSVYRKETDLENIRKGSMAKTTAAGEVNHRGKVRRQGSLLPQRVQ